MSERATRLARIAAVQSQMVKLAEWKLAAAQRDHEGLLNERDLLTRFVSGEDALSAGLGRAALRTGRVIDGRITRTESEVTALESRLKDLRRRDKTMAAITVEAKQAARREDEAKMLGDTMEAWLARASLP